MATDLEKLVVQLSADFKAFERGMARAQGVSNRQFNAIERRAKQLDTRLGAIGRSAARSFVAPLTGLGAALGTREIARFADTWTEAGNKIRAAGEIAGVATRSLNGIKDIANETRAGFAETADLYARLIRSASAVAKSEDEIATAVKVVNEAFKAGGASASEQAAGIMQLGQALGSGLLQGDELRSIRENAPILAQAIAKEFNTTIAGLKKLGSEGELTSARIFKAIISAQKDVGSAFSKTNSTISDAIQRVNNEFTAYIGNADQSAGATRGLVEALQYLADNFKGVADVVVQFATVVIAALTGRALLGMVAGLGNAVVALGAFLTALRAGTAATATFTAALGPIGLLAGAAAAAIFLLYRAQGSADASASSFSHSIRANEAALTNATDATYAQVNALKELIATQAKAARAAATAAQGDFDVALGRKDVLYSATGLRFAPLDYAVDAADKKVTALSVVADKLEDQVKRVNDLAAGKESGYGKGGPAVDADSKGGKKSKADPFERSMRAVADRTASIVAETEAQRQLNPLVNDYGYAAEKARTERELLNAAEKAGKAITPELRASVSALAEQYAFATAESAKLAEKQDELRQSFEDMRDLGKDVMGGFIHDLIEGKSASEALAGALAKVGDKLLELAMNDLFGKSGSGGLGLLGSLFGFGGGGGFSAASYAGIGQGLFSSGGYTGPGGVNDPAGIVHKGEIVWSQDDVRKAGGVAAVEAMRRGMAGYAGGGPVAIPAVPTMPSLSSMGSGGRSNVSFSMSVTVSGNGDKELLDRVHRGTEIQMREALRNYDQSVLPHRVNQIAADPHAVG